MAYVAIANVISESDNSFAETANLTAVTPEKMHHKPEGCLTAYPRK
jgi:hypothetical protein